MIRYNIIYNEYNYEYCLSMTTISYSVSPKGTKVQWSLPFSVAPPSFNFKVYAETLIEHC